MVSMKKIFEFFSIISLWELMSPEGVATFDPRGMVGRIYVGDYLTLLHTKYLSSGPHGFREEDFLKFVFHYKSVGAICCHGNQNSNPISPKVLCSFSY